MLSRRSLVLGGLATVAGVATAGRAGASVARALTLGELVHQSRHALVGTPLELFGQWETVGRRSRIVTYTLVRADHALDGQPPATSEIMVRTLGGRVGDIGQTVPGEAMLVLGRPASIFVEDLSRDLFAVTGMAQGHYPVQADDQGVKRLRAAAGLVELLGGANLADSAVHRLDGRTVTEVEGLVAGEIQRGAR
jgi:hypothetical protein